MKATTTTKNRLKKGEIFCLTCEEIVKSGGLESHSKSKSHLKNIKSKRGGIIKKQKDESSKILGGFKPSVYKESIKDKKDRIKKVSQKTIKDSIGNIKVLGTKVYISNQDTGLVAIGDDSGLIRCNQIFTLLEPKIQEFTIIVVKQLLKYKSEYGELKYLKSDEEALKYVIKKYPRTTKLFWVLAMKILFAEIVSGLNLNRLKNVSRLLKINNDKGVRKIIGEYKKELDRRNNVDLVDFGDGSEGDYEVGLVKEGFNVQNATEEKMPSRKPRLSKIKIALVQPMMSLANMKKQNRKLTKTKENDSNNNRKS